MTYVVAALGSAGDIHPFLAVARALHERGETVLMLANEPHRAEITAQGVPFEPIISTHQHQRVMAHPHLWHSIHGFGMLWRYFSIASMEPVVQILQRLSKESPQPVKVLAPPQVLGARLAREILPLHLTTAITAPTGLRTCADPLFLGPWKVPHWVPQFLRRSLWRALDTIKLEPLARPAIERWLTTHGRDRPDGPIFERWIHSPDQVISMFPKEFCADQGDWPVPVQMKGFPLYAATGIADEELVQFTQKADTPLHVFFPGSASGGRHPQMEATIARLSATRSHRCLWIGNPIDITNAHVLQRPWTDLPKALSNATTFIHHGGIGSCAHGLAKEVWQLVMPLAYDQFDNGARIQSLGAGQTVRDGTLTEHVLRATRYPQRQQTSTRTNWQVSRPRMPNAAVTAICEELMGRQRMRPAKSS